MKAIAIFGAFLGLTSVVMGAASDHLFSDFITTDNAKRLEAALRYHQLYAVLIFCLGLYGLNALSHVILKWAGYAFCAGTTIFCSSLYLSLHPNLSWLTLITPIGGFLIIVGWILGLLNLIRFRVSQG